MEIEHTSIMTTAELGHSGKHPLLVEDILDKIFAYFANDRKNLCSFRLVCNTWDRTAGRHIKKNLKWKVKFPALSATDDVEERETVELLLKSSHKEYLFRNFHISFTSAEGPDEVLVNKFLESFGSKIVEVTVSVRTHKALSLNILVEQSQYLPNLEHIEFNGLFRPLSVLPSVSFTSQLFPKLRSLTFSPVVISQPFTSFQRSLVISRATPVLQRILTDSLKLHTLEIGEPVWSIIPHGWANCNLEMLTCLKLRCLNNDCTISLDELNNIKQKCKRLRIFSATLSGSSVPQNQANEFIRSLASTLEELELENCYPPPQIDWENVPDFDADDEFELFIGEPDVDPFLIIPMEINNEHVFPTCPILKTLSLYNWQLYNSVDFNLPNLRFLDIIPKSSQTMSLTGPQNGHQKVRYLRFRHPDMNVGFIVSLSPIFPHITELDVEVDDDESVFPIYNEMSNLKRLHLNRSRITDTAITGIRMDDLNSRFKNSSERELLEADVNSVRSLPWICELRSLQHFTFDRNTLSKFSIYFGFKFLKELTYFRVAPFKETNDHYIRMEKVSVRPLVDNCPALVRVDVNGFTDTMSVSDDEEEYQDECMSKIEYKGCGLPDCDIKYIKHRAPNMEIVYKEKQPLSQWLESNNPDKY